jgi:peptidyl-prolyl cis-trans isomerase C
MLERAGEDPDAVLAQLGFTKARLRAKLSFASMWQNFLQDKVSEDHIRKYFDLRKEQFDGTEIRARQIYLPVKPDASEANVAEAEKQLSDWRKDIVAGKIAFEQAAAQWSQAPSAADGGDVGFFPYRGKMPADFSAAAFEQSVGEVGEPFRTRHGMHLVLVTEKRPGDFSLEDVRDAVTEQHHRDFWNALVKKQREKAKILISAE